MLCAVQRAEVLGDLGARLCTPRESWGRMNGHPQENGKADALIPSHWFAPHPMMAPTRRKNSRVGRFRRHGTAEDGNWVEEGFEVSP